MRVHTAHSFWAQGHHLCSPSAGASITQNGLSSPPIHSYFDHCPFIRFRVTPTTLAAPCCTATDCHALASALLTASSSSLTPSSSSPSTYFKFLNFTHSLHFRKITITLIYSVYNDLQYKKYKKKERLTLHSAHSK